MATVTKCDRCKKYVDRTSDSLPHITHRKKFDCCSKAHHLELCPECYESFLNWANEFNKVETVMVDCETDGE